MTLFPPLFFEREMCLLALVKTKSSDFTCKRSKQESSFSSRVYRKKTKIKDRDLKSILDMIFFHWISYHTLWSSMRFCLETIIFLSSSICFLKIRKLSSSWERNNGDKNYSLSPPLYFSIKHSPNEHKPLGQVERKH